MRSEKIFFSYLFSYCGVNERQDSLGRDSAWENEMSGSTNLSVILNSVSLPYDDMAGQNGRNDLFCQKWQTVDSAFDKFAVRTCGAYSGDQASSSRRSGRFTFQRKGNFPNSVFFLFKDSSMQATFLNHLLLETQKGVSITQAP